MSRTVEATGKNVAAATANALRQLGVTSDQAEISVINRGRRGLFGIFPGTPARVRVSHRESTRDRAETIVRDLLKRMQVGCMLDVVERRHDLHVNIETAGTDGVLIGKGGLTLISLEYLVNRMLQNENRKGQRVLLDVAGYKRRREDEPPDDQPDESRGRRGGRRREPRREQEEQPVGAAVGAGQAGAGLPGGRRRSGRGRRRRGSGRRPRPQEQAGEQK
jgi:spoIIIJ-associated protein